jgi:putative transposase
MVSRKWVATLVSAEETSTQVEVCFLAALEAEGLLEVIDQRDTERLRRALLSGHPEQIEAAVDGGQVPLLLAVSDNGPQMRSHSTREFLAGVHIAQHFGTTAHTPTDQAWIETLMALAEIRQGCSSKFPTLGGCHCSGRRVPVAA